MKEHQDRMTQTLQELRSGMFEQITAGATRLVSWLLLGSGAALTISFGALLDRKVRSTPEWEIATNHFQWSFFFAAALAICHWANGIQAWLMINRQVIALSQFVAAQELLTAAEQNSLTPEHRKTHLRGLIASASEEINSSPKNALRIYVLAGVIVALALASAYGFGVGIYLGSLEVVEQSRSIPIEAPSPPPNSDNPR